MFKQLWVRIEQACASVVVSMAGLITLITRITSFQLRAIFKYVFGPRAGRSGAALGLTQCHP